MIARLCDIVGGGREEVKHCHYRGYLQAVYCKEVRTDT